MHATSLGCNQPNLPTLYKLALKVSPGSADTQK